MTCELDDGLRRAAAQQRANAERALADLDVTPAQFAVLCVVSDQPGVSAADVARLERLTPPTMSVIVGNLNRKTLVEKRSHPDNARIQRLFITELGVRLVQEGAVRLKVSQRRLCSALPDAAEALVQQWLRDIAGSGP